MTVACVCASEVCGLKSKLKYNIWYCSNKLTVCKIKMLTHFLHDILNCVHAFFRPLLNISIFIGIASLKILWWIGLHFLLEFRVKRLKIITFMGDMKICSFYGLFLHKIKTNHTKRWSLNKIFGWTLLEFNDQMFSWRILCKWSFIATINWDLSFVPNYRNDRICT